MKEKREKRLNSELKKLIYEILSKKIKNPLISEIFSISAVEVSSDLDVAVAYVSIFSNNKQRADATFGAIVDSKGAVRKELAKVMRIKFIPEIRFKLDNSAEYGERIDKIISTFSYGENNDES